MSSRSCRYQRTRARNAARDVVVQKHRDALEWVLANLADPIRRAVRS